MKSKSIFLIVFSVLLFAFIVLSLKAMDFETSKDVLGIAVGVGVVAVVLGLLWILHEIAVLNVPPDSGSGIIWYLTWPIRIVWRLAVWILSIITLRLVVHWHARSRRRLRARAHAHRRMQEDLRQRDELRDLGAGILEIYLPETHHGWRSEEIMTAAGAFMEAMGYSYIPENEESATPYATR